MLALEFWSKSFNLDVIFFFFNIECFQNNIGVGHFHWLLTQISQFALNIDNIDIVYQKEKRKKPWN